MCGIFGVAHFHGPTSTRIRRRSMHNLLDVMGKSLIHRGPDEGGCYVDGHSGVLVGLGMRRLSIIDVTGGHQPIENEDGSVIAICNGEIYNYQELSQGLLSKGHQFRTRSDSEVIVHLYEEYGRECVEHLRGMFALAVWDKKKQELLLARDRVGIKPVFYHYDGTCLSFASEVRGLLPALDRCPDLRPQALLRLLRLQYLPAPDTAWRGIQKLSPGTVLWVNEQGMRTDRYWAPSGVAGVHTSEEHLSQQVLTRLGEAVRCHLISDVPIGAFLSGGLDSSAIVALMSREQADFYPHTFSVGFNGAPQYNELNYARMVASHYRTVHHELLITSQDVIDTLPGIVAHLDEPLTDPAIVPTNLLSKLAVQYVKVVLTGEGADELFGGYRRYSLDQFVSWYHWLPSSLRDAVPKWLQSYSVDRQVVQAFQALSHASPSKRHIDWVGTFTYDELVQIVSDPGEAACEQQKIDRLFSDYFDGESVENALKGMLQADFATWLPEDLLTKVDRMSMAASLEARVPYVDHPLVELTACIPSRFQFKNGRKTILKRAVAGLVPAEILSRKKMGFEVPLASWLRGPLREFARDILFWRDPLGLFNHTGVEQFLGQHLRGEQDRSRQIWSVLLIKLWYHVVVLGRSHAPS
jgi:asparagine synthase (glutamine-hydrolysing)